MKKVNVILASLILFGLMTGCNGSASQITMTLKAEGNVMFAVGGNGTATIDWGDGSPVETLSLVLLEEGYDMEQDHSGDVSHSYANPAEYTIKITGENIMMLWCYELHITNLELNVSTLISFNCTENQIKTLDVSKNTKLEKLACMSNELTSLDVSKNTALKMLYCGANQLTSLDVSKNTALENLWCDGNKLTTLDVSKNTNLEMLYCNNNEIMGLDVSNNPALAELNCSYNQIMKLDLSKNTKLVNVYCNNCLLWAKPLNELFQSLHSNSVFYYYDEDKSISIGGNTGTATCDRSIAENKGWGVYGD